jgi:hypothetical protein
MYNDNDIMICKTFDEILFSSNAKSKIMPLYIMKKLAYGILLAVLLSAVLPQLAFAQQYPGYNSGNTMTLEQELDLAKKKVEMVREHPGEGSGTPYLSANGVVGASAISGAIFGGIFVAFVVRAKQYENAQKRLAL